MSRSTYSRIPDSETTGYTSFRSSSRGGEADSNLVPRTPRSRSGNLTFAQNASTDMEHDDPLENLDKSYEMTYQSQTAPLLSSSASANFGDDVHLRAQRLMDAEPRNRPPAIRRALYRAINHLPLILGVVVSAVLCLLIFVSINWPDALQAMLQTSEPDALGDSSTPSDVSPGGNAPVTNNTAETEMGHNHTGHVLAIDYSAYTSFPLTPKQYLRECQKQQSNHFHGGYWDKPPGKILCYPYRSVELMFSSIEGGVADVPHAETKGNICSSTITFMFDGNRGLMADLALIAQLAGLAREVCILHRSQAVTNIIVIDC